MNATPSQIPLSLEHRPALGRDDFLISDSNAEAVAAVADWRGWPGRRMALMGPPRSGKTHLAHVWMQESAARLVAAAELDEAQAESLVAHGTAVIEDADRLADLSPMASKAAERALFHLLNLAAAEEAWVMVTGREAPARWRIGTPDLASRLAALPIARLAPPDDMLLSSLMVKLFADRQLKVAPGVIRYLASRIERSCAAAEDVVTALDRLSLARKRPVTRAMAAEVLNLTEGGQG